MNKLLMTFIVLLIANLTLAADPHQAPPGGNGSGGGGGLRRDGMILTFESAQMPLTGRPGLSSVPGLQPALNILQSGIFDSLMQDQLIRAMQPSLPAMSGRKYFSVDDSALDPTSRKDLLALYEKLKISKGIKNGEPVILAVTVGLETYLFPGFFNLVDSTGKTDPLGQAAILFHEELRVVAPSLSTESILELETAFEDFAKGNDDFRLFYLAQKYLGSGDIPVICAYYRHDLNSGALGNLANNQGELSYSVFANASALATQYSQSLFLQWLLTDRAQPSNRTSMTFKPDSLPDFVTSSCSDGYGRGPYCSGEIDSASVKVNPIWIRLKKPDSTFLSSTSFKAKWTGYWTEGGLGGYKQKNGTVPAMAHVAPVEFPSRETTFALLDLSLVEATIYNRIDPSQTIPNAPSDELLTPGTRIEVHDIKMQMLQGQAGSNETHVDARNNFGVRCKFSTASTAGIIEGPITLTILNEPGVSEKDNVPNCYSPVYDTHDDDTVICYFDSTARLRFTSSNMAFSDPQIIEMDCTKTEEFGDPSSSSLAPWTIQDVETGIASSFQGATFVVTPPSTSNR